MSKFNVTTQGSGNYMWHYWGEEGSSISGKHSLHPKEFWEKTAVFLYKPSSTHQKHIQFQARGFWVFFHSYFELFLRNKRIKMKQEIQNDPQRMNTGNFLMDSSWCCCCPLPNFLLGLCHGHLVQENQKVLNVLLTPALEKGKEAFEKVFFLTEQGSQQITVPVDAPDDTVPTQTPECPIAVVCLHFSAVSFWSSQAKQNNTVWVGFRW